MGTWGTAIFSDDLAADIKGEFRDLIGDGLSGPEAVSRLTAKYRKSLEDDDEAAVFWLALAAIQWKLGRLDDRTKQNALDVINRGTDLARWDDPKNLKARTKVLEKLKTQLLSPQPRAKKVPRRIRSNNQWVVGEVIAFRLLSGKWTLLRTIGHHTDYGGRSAVCELLDSSTAEVPPADVINRLPVRQGVTGRRLSQFLFQEPRKKADQARVVRLGVLSQPAQKLGGYTVLVWPFVDRQMKTLFGLK
ncbi:MAG: hypothetical protein ACTHM6_17955 [Tepidisphaeraceae bacterium]